MSMQFPCPVATLFSRRVRPGSEAAYEAWLDRITPASAAFPGYQGTTIVRPSAKRAEYLSIVQFDSPENLERWMDSPERTVLVEELGSITIDSEEVSSLTGMERWFTLPDRSVTQAPPKYKSALLLLLGLFPLAMIQGPIFEWLLGSWPVAFRVLVSLMVSIVLMVWLVMPMLTRLFFGWLYPEPKHRNP